VALPHWARRKDGRARSRPASAPKGDPLANVVRHALPLGVCMKVLITIVAAILSTEFVLLRT
jgi:hypothetical protein